MGVRALACLVAIGLCGGCTRSATRVTEPEESPSSTRRAQVTRIGGDGRVRWSVPLDAGDDSPNAIRPIIRGDSVITTMGGELRRLSLETGDEQWRHRAGKTINGAWLTGPRVLAVADQVSTSARVIGVDARTGELEWEWRVPGRGLMGAQKIVDDKDLAVITRSQIAVIDGATGRPRWTVDVKGGEFQGFETVAGAVLYADSGTLTSYASKTGAVRWTADFSPDDRPVVAGGVVTGSSVGAPRGGARNGIDVATGEVRWKLSVDDANDAGVMDGLRDTFLLVDSRSRRIRIVEAASGAVRWTADIGAPVIEEGSTAEVGSLLYVLRYAPKPAVLTFDMATGEVIHTVRLDETPEGPPTLAGGSIVLIGQGARSKLWSVRDGKILWSVDLPERASRGPTGLSDGGAVIEVVEPVTGGF